MFWWGKLRERGNLEGLSIDRSITLKCILKKRGGGLGSVLCGAGYGQVAGSCECGNYGGISVLAEEILAVQKGFCFMELDN